MRNLDEVHVLPGGQREPGETLVETAKREVLEEAGWKIEVAGTLGFIHFCHLEPEPPGFPYLYPEFTQVVFLADAVNYVPEAREPDDYEIEASFRTFTEARKLNLLLGTMLFVEAAVRLLARR